MLALCAVVRALLTDLGHAWRTARRSRRFHGLIGVVLSLSLAMLTAAFRVTRSQFWPRLPFPDADRLTMIWATLPGNDRMQMSLRDFEGLEAPTAEHGASGHHGRAAARAGVALGAGSVAIDARRYTIVGVAPEGFASSYPGKRACGAEGADGRGHRRHDHVGSVDLR
jgi:hypothetical protein